MRVQRGWVRTNPDGTKTPLVKVSLSATVTEADWDLAVKLAKTEDFDKDDIARMIIDYGMEQFILHFADENGHLPTD